MCIQMGTWGKWSRDIQTKSGGLEIRNLEIQGSGVQAGCRCLEGWILSRMMDGGSRADPAKV
jgi:hypothetical protein